MQAQGPNYRIVATWVLMVWLDATAPSAVYGQQVAPSLQDASVLAKAWSALATGRPSDVESLVAPLRARVPRHRDAWIVTVTARAAQAEGSNALDAYESWMQVSGAEDPLLLDVVAIGVLRELARAPETPVGQSAGRALARLGDRIGVPRNLPMPAVGTLEGDLARASQGDTEAVERVRMALTDKPGDKTSIIVGLRDAGAAAVPVFQQLLGDKVPVNRLMAALALGRAGDPSAVPALQRALKDPEPAVRDYAAVGLGLLGDASAREQLTALLSAVAPDVRLLAAEALARLGDTAALQTVTPFLESDQPMERIMAATILAGTQPQEAHAAIARSLGDANPEVRRQAALAVGQGAVRDAATLRGMLRNAEPLVRLHAALALLREDDAAPR